MTLEEVEGTTDMGKNARRKRILVLGAQAVYSKDTIDYAVHLAGRIDHDILALTVDTQWEGESFREQAISAARAFKQKAEAQGVDWESVLKQGDLGLAIEEITREQRRIEFVIADEKIDREALARQITLPIFSVLKGGFNNEGGRQMAHEQQIGKKKPVGKMIGYGLITAALYAAVFTHLDLVMEYCTRGGVYAAVPILVALGFSFAHGAFASNAYSVLGIEAAKKGALREVEKKVIEKQQNARKKPRAYAYINPFHRI